MITKSEHMHGHGHATVAERSLLRKWFPHPILSLVLIGQWLGLNNSLAPGHIVVAVLLAGFIPIYTANFWPNRPKLRAPFTFLVFAFVFLWDIVVANIQVAILVMFHSPTKLNSQWLCVPLDLRQPEAIAMLAGTVSLTPGTISSDLSADGRYLLVHCLHVDDPDAEVQKIKHRYERRLKAIFP
ncbi:MAG: Na+/H+ antiporter subunit E [Planctomycetaceae bacterium]|jgi:multicomponent K+:H+ antiporter subunit E|nr:Na+/H+ antiporter subunit E [Planctomycetaceae bacterium]